MQTEETALHPELSTRFDFDSIWGTALNRFCVQSAVGEPLTIYGKGGQTRGYLDIRDTMACITLTLDNPPNVGECRVFNQFTEQFSLNELADVVSSARDKKGLPTDIIHLPNPRVEAEEHYYNPIHTKLLDLGLKPHFLSDTLVTSVISLVERHKGNVDPVLLQIPSVDWRTGGNEIWKKYANKDEFTFNSRRTAHLVDSVR